MNYVLVLSICYTACIISGSCGFAAPPAEENQRREKEENSAESDEFEEVLKSSTFVDKSGFIREFFGSHQSLYITAPHGFGKSSAMNMLRKFAEVKVDVNGTRLDKNSTSVFSMFLDKRLEITKDSTFFYNHYGEYPVLHLKFKHISIGESRDSRSEFERFFRAVFVVAAKEHAYLGNSTKLTAAERKAYDAIYRNDLGNCPATRAKDLTRLLHKHHNKRCLVLIDDFDSSLSKILSNDRLQVADVEEILTTLQKFLSTLMQKNEYLEKGLVTGCVRLAPTPSEPQTLASNSENLNGVRTVAFGESENISKYFGYTDNEVLYLSRKLNKDLHMDIIRAWYGGYAVLKSKVKLFNMISVSKFLKTGNMTSYWSDGEDTERLKYIFDFRIVGDEVQKSLSRDTIRVMLNSHFSTVFSVKAVCDLFKEFARPRDTNATLEIEGTELFLKYLIDHGYYSVWHETRSVDDRVISATIPNYETRGKLDGFIYTPLFYRTKYNISRDEVTAIVQSIFNLTEAETGYKNFAAALSKLVDFVSPRDGASEWIRMLAVFADYSGDFEFVGREMLPKDQGVNFIIITKKPNSGKGHRTGILMRVMTKEGSAHAALVEIVRNGYYGIFQEKLKMISIGNKILIGVHINSNKVVSLSYLDGSIDMDNARNATSNP